MDRSGHWLHIVTVWIHMITHNLSSQEQDLTPQDQVNHTVSEILKVTKERKGFIACEVLKFKRSSCLSLRLSGETPWTLRDLDKLAKHWGCGVWELLREPELSIPHILLRRERQKIGKKRRVVTQSNTAMTASVRHTAMTA